MTEAASLIATFQNSAAIAIGIFVVALLVLTTLMWLAFWLPQDLTAIQKEAAMQGVARAVADKLFNEDAGAA